VIVKKHRQISNGNRGIFDFLRGGKGEVGGQSRKLKIKAFLNEFQEFWVK